MGVRAISIGVSPAFAELYRDPLAADYDGLPGDPATPAPPLALADLLHLARETPFPPSLRPQAATLIKLIEEGDPRAERLLRSLLEVR